MIKKAMPWYLNENRIRVFILTGLILFSAGNSCFGAKESIKRTENRQKVIVEGDFLAAESKIGLKEKGLLEISGSINEEKYNLTISLRHIKLGKSDISADFYTAGIILRTKKEN